MNWAVIGFSAMGAGLLAVALAAIKRQWSLGSLVAGLAVLPFAFVHAAAPFRGFLDADYPGYRLGALNVAPGIEVTMITGSLLVGGVICAVIAILNRSGRRLDFMIGYLVSVLMVTVPGQIAQALEDPASFRVEFGEYLQLAGISAFLFEFALLSGPLLYALAWAWGRALKKD